jgi:hypothetical protein
VIGFVNIPVRVAVFYRVPAINIEADQRYS